jgi:tetratricopeptide (TPR) repeat protein
LAFNPDGSRLLSSEFDGLVCSWETGPREIMPNAILERPSPLEWTNQGARLARLRRWQEAAAAYTHAIELEPDFWPACQCRGDIFAELKQWDKTVADYAKVLELNPQNAFLHDSLARNLVSRLDVNLGEPTRAVSWARKAVALAPKEVIYWTTLGMACSRAGLWDDALAAYSQAVTLKPFSWTHPTYVENRVELGHGLWRLSDLLTATKRTQDVERTLRMALSVFERLASDFPDDPFYRLEAAYTCLSRLGPFLAGQSGRRKDAEDVYRRGLDTHEKLVAGFPRRDPLYQRRLASNYDALADLLQGDGRTAQAEQIYRRAIEFYSKAIEVDPKFVPAWINRGRFYRDHHQYDKSLADLNQAITLDARNVEAWHRRGDTYASLRQYDKAVADYSKVVELDPKLAWAWSARGDYYRGLQQYDNALADYSKAIEVDPKFVPAWINRGRFYRDHHQYDKSLADLNQAIALDAANVHARINRGDTYAALHQYNKAVDDFSKAIDVDPKSALARASRGNVHSVLRQYDKALADCSKAVDLDPKFAWARESRGNAYLGLRQYDKAIADYRKAIELDPKSTSAHNNLGFALMQQADQTYANKLAPLHGSLKQFRKAEEVLQQCIGRCAKLAADFPTEHAYQDNWARSHHTLAALLHKIGRLGESEKHYREAISIWEKLGAGFPVQWYFRFYRIHAAVTYGYDLAPLLSASQQPREAEEALRQSVARWEKLVTDFPNDKSSASRRTQCQINLASMLSANGRAGEAVNAFSKVLEWAPVSALDHNNFAWQLATCADAKFRNPAWAVELAKKAVELAPKEGNCWNTLGVAHYHNADMKAAITALEKSMALRKGGDSFDWFFLAMARRQLGDKTAARKWYDQAVEWMHKNQPKNEELLRFRAEAEKVLELQK